MADDGGDDGGACRRGAVPVAGRGRVGSVGGGSVVVGYPRRHQPVLDTDHHQGDGVDEEHYFGFGVDVADA